MIWPLSFSSLLNTSICRSPIFQMYILYMNMLNTGMTHLGEILSIQRTHEVIFVLLSLKTRQFWVTRWISIYLQNSPGFATLGPRFLQKTSPQSPIKVYMILFLFLNPPFRKDITYIINTSLFVWRARLDFTSCNPTNLGLFFKRTNKEGLLSITCVLREERVAT